MVSQTMNYTATFTYHSDVMAGVGSNRSRIDSETSGSSESSRGSGKPPRRRSHRPRGCRGGSNRRRNNSSDDKGNKRANNNSNNSTNTVANENSRKTENGKAHNKGTKHSHHRQQNVDNSLQNISILSKRSKIFYADSSNKFEQDNQTYSATTTRAEYSLPAETYDMPQFQSNQFDYPGIQPSFSDSSSEGVPDPRMFQRPRPMARNMDGSLILPPLPANAFYSEPVPSGPNPYALKLDNHENFQHQQQQQQQQQQYGHYEPRMYGSGFMQSNSHVNSHGGGNSANNSSNNFIQPHHQQQQQQQQRNPNAMSLRIHTENNNIVAPLPMQQNNYKAERLEKQRQNVVGGSLFATSPRSFLFGLSKSAIPISGSA